MDPQDVFNSLHLVRNAPLTDTGASLSHSVVIPHATYSPWCDDQAFVEVYNAVTEHSLVDVYRCYELWSLVGQLAGTEGDILEVGVWRGGTGCLMASRAQTLAPSKRLFLADTFEGVVKAGDMDSHYQGGEHADASMDAVKDLAAGLDLHNIELLRGVFPDDTAALIEDRRFALCHIDVDVHDSARDITDWIWPRLSVGGCIVYDDYGFYTCEGVTRYVDRSAPRTGAIVLHNLNGHAVIVKLAP